MASVSEVAQKVAPQIIEKMQNANIGDKGYTKVTAANEIQQLCIDSDAAYMQRIQAWESAIHPDNRKQSGVEPSDVHILGNHFVDQA